MGLATAQAFAEAGAAVVLADINAVSSQIMAVPELPGGAVNANEHSGVQ